MDKTTLSKARSRLVPYDTGKVKIGMFYEPPRPRPEDHELLLQNVLLGTHQPKEPLWDRVINSLRFYTVFAIGFVAYLLVLFRS